MNMRSLIVCLVAIVTLPVMAYGQPTCVAPRLSDPQVKNIIDRERKERTDLPAPFPDYRWAVRRQGCHYVYVETGLPEGFHNQHTFKLNQRGVIVDVQTGDADTSSLTCPERVFTESELADIVASERAKRKDLPRPFPKSRTRVDRARCLYLYFEYALPERRGDYQVFTIDPFGELMEFTRSKPY